MLELSIIGNLGKDPEAHYTESGTLVCNFSVAETHKKNGKEETEWVEVTVWDKLAEACHQYLHKGSKVFVRGRPDVRAFTRKNGEPGAVLKITAQTVEFLSSKSNSGERQTATDEDPPF